MLEIKIVVDENDADYLTSVREISDEDLAKIMPLIEAIKQFKPYSLKAGQYGLTWTHDHNYVTGECQREDLGEKSVEEYYSQIDSETHELFQEFCPFSEHGFHTIKSIEVYPIPVKTKIL